MKVVVKQPFRDRNSFNVAYAAGMVLDFEDSRAQGLIARGLVASAEPEATPTPDGTPGPKSGRGRKPSSKPDKTTTEECPEPLIDSAIKE